MRRLVRGAALLPLHLRKRTILQTSCGPLAAWLSALRKCIAPRSDLATDLCNTQASSTCRHPLAALASCYERDSPEQRNGARWVLPANLWSFTGTAILSTPLDTPASPPSDLEHFQDSHRPGAGPESRAAAMIGSTITVPVMPRRVHGYGTQPKPPAQYPIPAPADPTPPVPRPRSDTFPWSVTPTTQAPIAAAESSAASRGLLPATPRRSPVSLAANRLAVAPSCRAECKGRDMPPP